MGARLLEQYRSKIVPALSKRFGYRNAFQAPRVRKIVLNMGIGQGAQEIKLIEKAADELALITGQRPVVTRAKKAIANFKIKKGNPVGLKVTLRGARMYEFLDRLVNVALPRIRDFRGISPQAFDGRGGYSLGLREQYIFPEIEFDKVDKVRGMDVVIVTDAKTRDEALELLRHLGMPFRAS